MCCNPCLFKTTHSNLCGPGMVLFMSDRVGSCEFLLHAANICSNTCAKNQTGISQMFRTISIVEAVRELTYTHSRTYIYIYIHIQVNSHVEEVVCLSKKEPVCHARRPCLLHVPLLEHSTSIIACIACVSGSHTCLQTNTHAHIPFLYVVYMCMALIIAVSDFER